LTAGLLRFALWLLANLLFRVRVQGREHIPTVGPAVLVANHISYADPVLVGYTIPRRNVQFLMWQPIFDLPIANWFFRALRAIPIDSKSPRSVIRALRAARAELQSGELVGIFPEGAISLTGETQNFERGFDKVLRGTGTPVIPIHIHGLYGHPFSYKNGGPFRSWENLWRPVVTVRVGAPIYESLSPEELRQAVLDA
jgi:1-acyl-sn-glycerol-3-phosphate acyltransferase